MKNDLSCNVVKDLLPSYTDKLTSEESNAAIEKHLKECEQCREMLEYIKEPPKDTTEKEKLDYLKKLRTKGRLKTAIISAASIVAVLLAAICYFVFYVGQEIPSDNISYTADKDGDVLVLDASHTNNVAITRAEITKDGNDVRIGFRSAPKTFFNSSEYELKYTLPENVKTVYVNNRIVWTEGELISDYASRLFAAKNPYVGDISADYKIMNIIGVSEQFGKYTTELRTGAGSNILVIDITEPLETELKYEYMDTMITDSAVMFATIENLDCITWKYTTSDGDEELTENAEDYSSFTDGLSIKTCYDSIVELNKMLFSMNR